MPTWFPFTLEMQGFSTVNVSRAVEAGLTFRPLAVTARDTLEWVEGWPEERKRRPLRFGISPEREAEVLQAWHERMG
jgi:2'-hydroxyisoflavone reductase